MRPFLPFPFAAPNAFVFYMIFTNNLMALLALVVQLPPAIATYTTSSSLPAEAPLAPVLAPSPEPGRLFAVIALGHTQYKVTVVRACVRGLFVAT